MRPRLPEEKIHENAVKAIQNFHPAVLVEIQNAVKNNEWVIVGMGGNPFVKKARNLLEKKGMAFKYLGYGSYVSQWKQRLAIKLWSGWPTFPQVFHKGSLVGGYQDLEKYLERA